MSVTRTRYVIAGYDLTRFQDILLADDWKWKPENEQYSCYQSKNNIQLFDDPMSGEYLYFGYIFAVLDEDDDSEVSHIPIEEFQEKKVLVDYKLQEMGWSSKLPREPIPYEVIAFTECC